MSRDWRDFLADVVRHAELAVAIVEGVEPIGLAADPVRRLALERALEIIGEAAGKVPAAVRQRYPDVPWQAMIGARVRLAHAYFALDHDLLWRTAREIIPPMLPRLGEVARLEGADQPPPTENRSS